MFNDYKIFRDLIVQEFDTLGSAKKKIKTQDDYESFIINCKVLGMDCALMSNFSILLLTESIKRSGWPTTIMHRNHILVSKAGLGYSEAVKYITDNTNMHQL